MRGSLRIWTSKFRNQVVGSYPTGGYSKIMCWGYIMANICTAAELLDKLDKHDKYRKSQQGGKQLDLGGL